MARVLRPLGLYAIAVAVGIVLVLPYYWAVVGSLKQMFEVRQLPLVWWPTVAQWINYWDVWNVRYFPNWFTNGLGVNFYFGGTSLLIVVGVAMDTVQQVESQLIMRHYDGFMKKSRIRGRRG